MNRNIIGELNQKDAEELDKLIFQNEKLKYFKKLEQLLAALYLKHNMD